MCRNSYKQYHVQKDVIAAGHIENQIKSRENTERFCRSIQKGNVHDISFLYCLTPHPCVGWRSCALSKGKKQFCFLRGARVRMAAPSPAATSGFGAYGCRQSQKNGPGLRHIERIKSPRQGYAQHMRAPLGHAWPQSLVFVAQHQNGGQAHGFCKGVQAPGSGLAACAVDGQSGFFSAVQGMPQVCHAGHGQMLQCSGGGAAGGRAKIGAVVTGHDDARAPRA